MTPGLSLKELCQERILLQYKIGQVWADLLRFATRFTNLGLQLAPKSWLIEFSRNMNMTTAPRDATVFKSVSWIASLLKGRALYSFLECPNPVWHPCSSSGRVLAQGWVVLTYQRPGSRTVAILESGRGGLPQFYDGQYWPSFETITISKSTKPHVWHGSQIHLIFLTFTWWERP